METCRCDPLRKCLATFFCSLVMKQDFLYLSTNFRRKGNPEAEKPAIQKTVNMFLEKCINSFKGLVLRHQLNCKNVTVTITYENLKKAEELCLLFKTKFPEASCFQFELRSQTLCAIDLTQFDEVFPLTKITFDNRENVQIQLRNDTVFKSVTRWIVENFPRSCHRKNSCTSKNIKLDIGLMELSEAAKNIPLVQYRKFLTARYIMKAMGKSGFDVDVNKFSRLPQTEGFQNQVFLVFSNTAPITECIREEDPTVFRMTVGNAHLRNSSTNEVRVNATAEYLFNLRYEQVNAVSLSRASTEQKCSPTWPSAVSNLTAATINYDILYKDPKSDVTFIHNDEHVGNSFQDKGALVIMYNYARVVSILKTFEQNVESGMYPDLPSLDDIDLSSITQSELNLLNLLLQWPRTVENTVDLTRHEININPVLKLMKEITQRFIHFYTTEHVLMKNPTPHNFGEMMKKIYLLKAVRNIYEEFFELLLVDFDKAM